MLLWEPAQLRDLGQAGFAALQLCLWQGEGVGGGSDGTGTRRSEMLTARAVAPAHAAAVGNGRWQPPKPGCARCLADPLPLTLRGRLPAAVPSLTRLRFQGRSGGGRWVSAPPAAALCSSQTSTPSRGGSQPSEGGRQPRSQQHFQADSSFFSTLTSAEAGGQREDEAGAGRGG